MKGVINDFSLHENEIIWPLFCHISPLTFCYFLYLSHLGTLLIMIIHSVSGHNPRTHPFPFSSSEKAQSSSVMTQSQHSCNNWLRVLSQDKRPPALFLTNQNHLVLYFIALLHKMHIFLYYYKFLLLLFSYLSGLK